MFDDFDKFHDETMRRLEAFQTRTLFLVVGAWLGLIALIVLAVSTIVYLAR